MRIRTLFSSLTLIALGVNAPAMASDSLIDDLPMPEVVASLTQNVCVMAAKTGQPVSALLPSMARPFTKEDLAGRLQTRPYDGQIWAIDTVEGPVIIGTISDTQNGCQVLAATPFADVLNRKFQDNIQKGPDGFQLTAEQGSGVDRNGVTWSRYKTADGVFLDTLMYAFKGAHKEGTLHVIFKP